MNKSIFALLGMIGMSIFLFGFMLKTKWQIEPGYQIAFSSTDASGIFKTFSGFIVFDEKDLKNSNFDVGIDVSSINTGNGLQNKHAKEANWLDAKTYPKITYKSTEITKSNTGFTVNGTLHMKGKSVPTSIPFTFVNKGSTGQFEGKFSVKLSDFNIGKPGEVDNNIQLTIKVPVKK